MTRKVMNDKVLESFLEAQNREGLALARESDILDLYPQGITPVQCWIARFRCKGLVTTRDGQVSEADDFAVGIYFPDDYLRRAHPAEVLTWLNPSRPHHPNVSPDLPLICIGRMSPGMGLVEILYQVFEIITYGKVTMNERDALNKAACRWARQNTHLFPIDKRPLKRQRMQIQVNAREEVKPK
jgi:malate synthase